LLHLGGLLRFLLRYPLDHFQEGLLETLDDLHVLAGVGREG
jgi:hypothetical protein